MAKKINILLLIILIFLSFSFSSCVVNGAAEFKEEPTPLKEKPKAVTEEVEPGFISYLSVVGRLKIPGQAIDVDIEGYYAYLTSDLGELYIIDVSDKKNPKIVSKVRDIDSANIVILKDNYAYVSYTSWKSEDEIIFTECGFKIVDVRNKKNPKLVGNYISGSGIRKSVQGIFIEGDYAYLNSTEWIDDIKKSKLEIVDIKNKKRPRLLGTLEVEGMPWSVFVEGGYVYINTTIYDEKLVMGEESKLLVVGIEEKESPKFMGSLKVPTGTSGIYVKDDFAYVSSHMMEADDYGSFLQVIDLEDKKNPKIMGKTEIPGKAWELDMIYNFIYVSDLSGGVFTVSVTDKDNPEISDYIFTSGTSYDVTIYGDYGYIADGFNGIVILSLSGEDKEDYDFYIEENLPPKAIIEIFGDGIDDGYFPSGVPVYFSSEGSYDPDGDVLEYIWEVDGEVFEDSRISYVFNNTGEYEIKLGVSDGKLSDETIEIIKIGDISHCIKKVKEDNFLVEIEYKLINNGPGALENIECFITTPQNYYPFQIINKITPDIEDTETIYDENWNEITRFDFGDFILEENDNLTATILADVTMIRFSFLDLDYTYLNYRVDDLDLILYTMDDLYIDSKNPLIEKTAKSIVRDEVSPVIIMEKLYNYVINRLSYDYRRSEDRNYELLYASEIIKIGKGICTDYAILYTALLRASGIPSRVVSGIPIYTILLRGENEIDMGHAWVEVKFPEYGWIPVDITIEHRFMAEDYNMNLATNKGSGFLHKSKTMDWTSYYYDGFRFTWDSETPPETEQLLTFRIK